MDREQQREYLVLRMVLLAMGEGLSDVNARADFIDRTCHYGRGFQVTPAEVGAILQKPLQEIVFRNMTE